jgi:tetratricopeptide (TPR) repeat protein
MVRGAGPPQALNSAIDALVAAGRYGDALALPGQFVNRGARDSESEILVQINLAEAEYNLGRWSEAGERLLGLDPLAAMFPITRAGLAQQRSWIAAHTGKPDEALHQWKRAELRDLPRNYYAEHCFTGTVALLGVGDLDAALGCARAGAEVAVRPSSKRNALFIQARVAAAMNDWPLADSLCRSAAENPYRKQGGDGLLFWGEVLTRLGWRAQARQAWLLATERDAESESAGIAAERLNS